VLTVDFIPGYECLDEFGLKYWAGSIPWVSSGEVRNNVISETRELITKAGQQNSSVKLLPKGTVLLAMIGEGKTRGQSAILGIEATINQNIAAVVIDHGMVVPEFLWWWFQLQYEQTRRRGAGNGPKALNCQAGERREDVAALLNVNPTTLYRTLAG
jgi:type I restriction enzyme, S subunit